MSPDARGSVLPSISTKAKTQGVSDERKCLYSCSGIFYGKGPRLVLQPLAILQRIALSRAPGTVAGGWGERGHEGNTYGCGHGGLEGGTEEPAACWASAPERLSSS